MLLKKEFHGTKRFEDIEDFWARDLDISQCVEETGLDVETVYAEYLRLEEEFCKSIEREC